MLVNGKQLLMEAKKNGYAIPAANFIDMDCARAYVEAAEEMHMPLILAYAQSHQGMLSLEEAAMIGKYYAEQAAIPVVLHLDHATDLDFIQKALRLGFTSVMIDASIYSLQDNQKITRSVIDMAQIYHAAVEAELGHVGSANDEDIYTKVEELSEFLNGTAVDSLAVSIGTAHGVYQRKVHLDFERLQNLHASASVPLVLHGGSSSGDENLERCAVGGIAKINIFTDFMLAADKAIKEMESASYPDLKVCIREAMKNTLQHYYQVFHTQNWRGVDLHE